MSEESSSSDVTCSPSLLSNLRQFRFQKSVTKMNQSDGLSKSSPEIGTKRKVVSRIHDSDTEEETNSSINITAKVIRTREKCLCILVEAFPTVDKMVLQDVLVHSNWNAELAKAELNKKYPDTKRPRELENSSPKQKLKKARKDLDTLGDDDDDYEDGNSNPFGENVFNSDDSDDEIPDIATSQQKRVLEFLSTATLMELKAMPSISQKKAEALIEKRPFESWKDLIEKLRTGKFLGTDLLNNAQNFLNMWRQVEALMTKCSNIAKNMESAILAGSGGIKKQPSLISENLTLTSYQMVGLNWLLVMHNQQLNGILADEMGLGKTVQVIAFFAHLKEMSMMKEKEEKHRPHVIVVPASTLENWKNELDRWCPSLNVSKYHGNQYERKAMRVKWVHEGMENIDVILTTYSMMSNTPEEKKMFRVLPFHYAVIDEAHLLKNMTTQRYEAMMRVNAQHRILLTGTPLQNNLVELMSLLIFVMPKIFAGRKEDLKSLFSKIPKQTVIENGEAPSSLSTFEQNQVDRARQIMKPFVLRRLKCDVLKDLPKKTDETLSVPLLPCQQKKYDELISAFKKSARESGTHEKNFLMMMMQLRKLSNHPLLLRYYYQDDQLIEIASILAADSTYKEDNKDHILEDLTFMSDFEIHQLTQEKGLQKYYLPSDLILQSGKFKMLDEILLKLKSENHRVVFFSQFVIMLNVVEEYLKLRGHLYLRLDGNTPVPTRQGLINTFMEDPSIFIFIVSTRAGGLGINLTAADTVIIHDLDFNPHNDRQAEDRCHRVGQTRDVTVLRMLSRGTIEEVIYAKAQEKLNLEREMNSEDAKATEAKNVSSLIKQTLGIESSRSINSSKKS